jgi:hypothetical protein
MQTKVRIWGIENHGVKVWQGFLRYEPQGKFLRTLLLFLMF